MGGMIPPVEIDTSKLLMSEMEISEIPASDMPNLVSLSSSPLQQSQGATTVHLNQRLHANDGSSNLPIQVETTKDDDVQILLSPIFFPQTTARPRMMRAEIEAVTEVPLVRLGWTFSEKSFEACKKRSGTSASIFIENEASSDRNVKMRNSEELTLPPKEPVFNCPICLSPFLNACSTNCGHIFCQACIKASIKAQKKCPTCRKKLSMRDFHRVYLPSSV